MLPPVLSLLLADEVATPLSQLCVPAVVAAREAGGTLVRGRTHPTDCVSHLQVALLCGLDDAAKRDLLKGPTHGGSHLHNLLKFLTVRSEKGSTRAGITLLGGPHDPAADGDDPERCQPSPPLPHVGHQASSTLS